jgi:hypothetical protein
MSVGENTLQCIFIMIKRFDINGIGYTKLKYQEEKTCISIT